MIYGAMLARYGVSMPGNSTAMAQPSPTQIVWNTNGKMPLDLQLDLEKRLPNESSPKDSIHIIDSVHVVEKVVWKTRYKRAADCTTAREVGQHLAPATPDSMSVNPTIISTVEHREEQATEDVGVSKTPSIQLSVDGKVVYSTDDNHSAEEGQ